MQGRMRCFTRIRRPEKELVASDEETLKVESQEDRARLDEETG